MLNISSGLHCPTRDYWRPLNYYVRGWLDEQAKEGKRKGKLPDTKLVLWQKLGAFYGGPVACYLLYWEKLTSIWAGKSWRWTQVSLSGKGVGESRSKSASKKVRAGQFRTPLLISWMIIFTCDSQAHINTSTGLDGLCLVCGGAACGGVVAAALYQPNLCWCTKHIIRLSLIYPILRL